MTTQQPMDAASALALLNQVSHETAEGQSPLRDFYGRLVEIKTYEAPQTNDDGSMRMTFRLQYMFDQVRVIHSISTWIYETADLSFFINNPSEAMQPTNRTGIFFDSTSEILGKQSKPPDGYNKMYHIKWLEGHPMKRRVSAGVYEDYLGPAYRVVDIDGKASATPWVEPPKVVATNNVSSVAEAAVTAVANVAASLTAVPVPQGVVDVDSHLVSLAIGKNHPQTTAAWMGDPMVTTDPVLFGKIVTDNGATVANDLMAAGKMVNTDGIYGPGTPGLPV